MLLMLLLLASLVLALPQNGVIITSELFCTDAQRALVGFAGVQLVGGVLEQQSSRPVEQPEESSAALVATGGGRRGLG